MKEREREGEKEKEVDKSDTAAFLGSYVMLFIIIM